MRVHTDSDHLACMPESPNGCQRCIIVPPLVCCELCQPRLFEDFAISDPKLWPKFTCKWLLHGYWGCCDIIVREWQIMTRISPVGDHFDAIVAYCLPMFSSSRREGFGGRRWSCDLCLWLFSYLSRISKNARSRMGPPNPNRGWVGACPSKANFAW